MVSTAKVPSVTGTGEGHIGTLILAAIARAAMPSTTSATRLAVSAAPSVGPRSDSNMSRVPNAISRIPLVSPEEIYAPAPSQVQDANDGPACSPLSSRSFSVGQ